MGVMEDIVVVTIAVLVLVGGAVYIIAALYGIIARLRCELKKQTAVIDAQGDSIIVLWQQRQEHAKSDQEKRKPPMIAKEKKDVWWYDHA